MKAIDWSSILEKQPITASAPCRVDLGGTLDIKTFYLPLAALNPATFNMAVDLRTRVILYPGRRGQVRVTSRGFEEASFPAAEAPFDHPLGLMFAVAAYFSADGVHIDIHSESPPRSALGGSSAAAVALVAAFRAGLGRPCDDAGKTDIVLTAHALEEGVARVPCGLQDQLAAAHGGVNAWYWRFSAGQPPYQRKQVIDNDRCRELNDRLLLAYCGIPHESRQINGRWIDQFLKGDTRSIWRAIIGCTADFIESVQAGDMARAVAAMNQEADLRKKMTPDVFDDMGEKLVESARAGKCGVRFTGAGGGGCVWALGEPADIERLRGEWRLLLAAGEDAGLLEAGIDPEGVVVL